MNFYIVTAKCGHVGKNYYIAIDFPIKAHSKSSAAKIARNIPRVKHDHKDAILDCREVSEEEYNKQVEINNNNPYLKCMSIRDQNMLCDLHDMLIPETRQEQQAVKKEQEKEQRKNRVAFKLKKQKINSNEHLRLSKHSTD